MIVCDISERIDTLPNTSWYHLAYFILNINFQFFIINKFQKNKWLKFQLEIIISSPFTYTSIIKMKTFELRNSILACNFFWKQIATRSLLLVSQSGHNNIFISLCHRNLPLRKIPKNVIVTSSLNKLSWNFNTINWFYVPTFQPSFVQIQLTAIEI